MRRKGQTVRDLRRDAERRGAYAWYKTSSQPCVLVTEKSQLWTLTPLLRSIKVAMSPDLTKIYRCRVCPQVSGVSNMPDKSIGHNSGQFEHRGDFAGLPAMHSNGIGISLFQTNEQTNSKGFMQQTTRQGGRE
jgi:hypothetical protein